MKKVFLFLVLMLCIFYNNDCYANKSSFNEYIALTPEEIFRMSEAAERRKQEESEKRAKIITIIVAFVSCTLVAVVVINQRKKEKSLQTDHTGRTWNYVCDDDVGNKYFVDFSSSMAYSDNFSDGFALMFNVKKFFGQMELRRLNNTIKNVNLNDHNQSLPTYEIIFVCLKVIKNQKFFALIDDKIYFEDNSVCSEKSFDKNNLNFYIISDDSPISKSYEMIRKNL